MIKNIILDMGNVLLYFRPELALKEFFETEEDRNIIRKELFKGPEWIMADEGKITNAERYDRVSLRVPERLHSKLKECVEGWHMCMSPVTAAKEFCEDMKKKGYHIYVLSNACDRFHTYFPKFYDTDFFDGIVVSSDVHMIKPDAKIYQYLLDTYYLNAEECLFLDDREENVEAAKGVGMKAEIFEDNYNEIRERYKL